MRMQFLRGSQSVFRDSGGHTGGALGLRASGASAAPELVLPEYAYLNKRMRDDSLTLTTVSK